MRLPVRQAIWAWRESAAGIEADFAQVLTAQQQRDAEDQSRPFGALAAAPDAFVLNTDGLSVEEVVERLVSRWRQQSAT